MPLHLKFCSHRFISRKFSSCSEGGPLNCILFRIAASIMQRNFPANFHCQKIFMNTFVCMIDQYSGLDILSSSECYHYSRIQGMLLRTRMQNFRKLAQLKIRKNRGELKRPTKILNIYLMPKMWAQNHKLYFGEGINFNNIKAINFLFNIIYIYTNLVQQSRL